MCRQFIAISMEDLDKIMNEVRAKKYVNISPDWPARAIPVFPQSTIPLLVHTPTGVVIRKKTWGYPADWSKSPVFNTRCDSAHKDIWRESVEQRRCVVASLGFFEPHHTETTASKKTGRQIKQEYFFEMPDNSPLFMAGIHQGDYFSLMTTEPNHSVKPVHDRMPLVLRQGELRTWLGPNYRSLFDRTGFEIAVSKVR